MSSIDRIRFYDGEFLRAFDFSDEQTYHMEMRRRVNRYLHLYGIVYGLTLSSDSEGGVTQVSITPGLAIDGFGREIYVFAPYTLGDSDITANRIPATGGTYDVWLRYQKTPSTPPSAGYGNCNQANQYTRWVESFSIVLLPSPSNPSTDPAFTDQDTDDPSQDQAGALLGTVSVAPTSVTAVFSSPNADPNRCKLLGVVAQAIQIPTPWDATEANPPFSFLNNYSASSSPPGPTPGTLNNPLGPVGASLEIEPNIFADQNLIVGRDFPLTSVTGGTQVTITPGTTVQDPGAGSVKIAGDLFVKGNIYNLITSSTSPPTAPSAFPPPPGTNLWLAISSYVELLVQQSLPDFVATQTPFNWKVNPTAAGTFSETFSFTIPSKLASMSSVVATAAIAGIQFNAPVHHVSNAELAITNVSASKGSNQCTIWVTYSVANVRAVGPGFFSPILSFWVSAAAVCFPGP